MDSNSYNSIHIVTESVIMGAVSMYFYKKISDLETIVKDLQQQVVVQNGQLNELKNYLSNSVAQSATSRRPPVGSSVVSPPYERAERSSPQKTLLRIPTQREMVKPSQGYSLPAQSREPDPGIGRSLSEPNPEGVGRQLPFGQLVGQRVAGLSSDDRRPRLDREMTKSLEAHLGSVVEGAERPSPRRIGSRIPESGIEERRIGTDSSQSDERRPLALCKLGNDELVERDAFGVCSDGVCKLVSDGKKVVISKISKQAEFDRESFQVNHPLKVETFKRTSPNPIIKSVTPKPSESISETVEQILNEINNE